MDLLSQYLQKKLYFLEKGYQSFQLKAVHSNYYEEDISTRKTILGAPDESYLCKCIIMENTAFEPDFENEHYQKFYCIIVQYITKMNIMKLEKKLKDIHNAHHSKQLLSKQFHLRLLKEDQNELMTGYIHNGVEPFMMKSPLPIILSHLIAKKGFFWLGGGHVDLKIRVSVEEFLRKWDRSHLFIIDLI